MRASLTVARREFRAYWDSPIAYVFLTVFLIASAFLFFDEFFARKIADVSALFGVLPLLFLFLVPLVTMRLWAEERRTGTEELLLTFPLRIRDAVIGKFLAAWALLAVALALTLPIVATVAWLSGGGSSPGLDLGPVAGGYLVALLMGGAYLAIGLFMSSATQHQIVAAVLTLAVLGALWVIGMPFVIAALPGWARPWAEVIALGSHFRAVARGLIDLRDVVYYATIIALFLGLNGILVDARRWK